jgi:hypothetical protein
MDLMQVLQSQMSDDVLEQIGSQIGADKQQTAAAAQGAFASILGGLAKNASSQDGLSALSSVLDKDHDGSILDDLAGLVGQGAMFEGQHVDNRALDGNGILRHVLGGQEEMAAQRVSQNSGLSMDKVMKLLPILAPIVMGVLGKQKRSGGLDLGSMASILMGSAQNAGQQSGMGDLVGTILGEVMGGGSQRQSGGGLFGKILGGLLGGRK